MKRSTARLLGIWLVAVVVLLGSLVVPLPQGRRWGQATLDFWHAPSFFVITWLTIVTLSRVGLSREASRTHKPLPAWWLAAGTAVVWSLAGGGLEWLQGSVGRSATWSDALANAWGAAGGSVLAWAWPRRGTRRWLGTAVALALLAAGCYRPARVLADVAWQTWQLPEIGSFESTLELLRWEGQGAVLARVPADTRPNLPGDPIHGRWLLSVELQPGSSYPGLDLVAPPADWSRYRTLRFAIRSAGQETWPLIVKIVDEPHNNQTDDRFHRLVQVGPAWQTVVIPLDQVRQAPRARDLDLRRIQYVQWFTGPVRQPRRFLLDHVRLE